MKYYYKCAASSEVGEKIHSFMERARHAAEAAEKYACKYGAAEYIQPVQFFEGGIDFLIFNIRPDAKVWRKRTDLGDEAVWEPNCTARYGVQQFDDTRIMPSDTWCRIYKKQFLSWEEAHAQYDIDESKKDKVFLPYIEFKVKESRGFGNKGCKPSAFARVAVRAERERLSLPVVRTEELFDILNVATSVDGISYMSPTETPVFFIYNDTYYISITVPCVSAHLDTITAKEFDEKKNAALAGT